MKELKKAIDRNADFCKKGTRNYKEEPRKIRALICWDESGVKAMTSRMNNVGE